ncbi:NUDIX domain-containing protein [Micromonospora sp. NPDC048935]|uniref:NUDIX domain-containing protein n=1 Tax=Micromonospora sp. NPDC048935 TaxID=3364262 RepID=UPI003721E831
MPAERRDFTADLPRKRMAAGVFLTDPRGRVLLVEPAYTASWEIPGGCVEADESPYQPAAHERLPALLARRIAAAREARGHGFTRYLENGLPVT